LGTLWVLCVRWGRRDGRMLEYVIVRNEKVHKETVAVWVGEWQGRREKKRRRDERKHDREKGA